jgi:hypothetical protein
MEGKQNGQVETNEQTAEQHLESGLMCLVTASRLLGVPADYQQLKRAFAVTDNDRIDSRGRQTVRKRLIFQSYYL